MAQKTLNNNETALEIRVKINENFTDLYTDKAQKDHSSITTEYGVASTNSFGHIKIGANINVNNGIVSINDATILQKGIVQLTSSLTDNSESKAATAAAVKTLKDSAIVVLHGAEVPSNSLGEDGNLYIQI